MIGVPHPVWKDGMIVRTVEGSIKYTFIEKTTGRSLLQHNRYQAKFDRYQLNYKRYRSEENRYRLQIGKSV